MGSISHPEILEKVESAKLLISIGSVLSDFNTGNFTYHIPRSKTIEVRLQSVHMLLSVGQSSPISFTPTIPESCMRSTPESASRGSFLT